jgi:hypothetical protein
MQEIKVHSRVKVGGIIYLSISYLLLYTNLVFRLLFKKIFLYNRVLPLYRRVRYLVPTRTAQLY